VLTPGGRLILSVDHPSAAYLFDRMAEGKTSYFQTRPRTEEWTMGGQTAQLTFWDRPLHAMTDAFTAAGFRISVISEPPPVAAAYDLFPDEFHGLTGTSFLSFLFFVLQAS